MIKNKKGGVIYYFILLALIVAVGYGIYLSIIKVDNLNYTGETSQKILSTIELANRFQLYVDMSINQAIKKATLGLEEDSGFIIERSANFKTPYPCDEAIYPIINKDQTLDCFPDYKEKFKNEFDSNLRININSFQEIDTTNMFFTSALIENQNEILLNVYTDPISIPIYLDFGTYYISEIRNKMLNIAPSQGYILDDQTGYYVRGGLIPVKRANENHPDTIVLHYTGGHKVDHAYDALFKNKLSYHYIIERDGTIYNFIDEAMAAQHAGCSNSDDTCKAGYNQRSIGISFVNLGYGAKEDCTTVPEFNSIRNACWQNYPREQISATIKLIADIFERQAATGNYMKLNTDTIITHHDIDPRRKSDPGPLISKQQLISDIKTELNERGYNYET